MSDEQEFEQFRDQLRSMVGPMGRFTVATEAAARASDRGRQASEDQLKSDFRKSKGWTDALDKSQTSARNLSSGMGVLSGNLDAASDRLREFSNAVPGGALLGSIAAWGKNTVDTWRQMTDVGQSFNGSIFSLAQAATEAGLPLSEFADAIKKNSKTVAVFGSRSVMGLMKSVRQQTEATGMYGFTIEGLNQVTGEYLENQRLYGNKAAATNSRTIKSSIEFAKQVTAMAGATGRSREEIMAATSSAMREVAMISRTVGMSSDQIQSFSDSALQASVILSGLPGVAGETFGTFFNQTAGYGTAIFADATTTFIEGGLGQMVGAMDSLANSTINGAGDVEGATWGMIEDFKGQVEANQQSLQIQAMAGNDASKKILQMYGEVRLLTRAQYEAKKKEAEETKSLTAFLASAGNMFKRLFSGLLTGLFSKFADIEAGMDSLVESDAFKALEERFTGFGKTLGEMFANIGPEEVKNFADGVEAVARGIFALAGFVLTLAGWVTKAITGFQNFFAVFTGGNKTLGTILGLGFAMLLPTLIKGIFGAIVNNIVGSRVGAMRVVADQVYVNGGAGMGMGGGGRGGRRGARAGARGGRFGSRYGNGTTAERMAQRSAMRGGGRGLAGAAGAAGIAGGLMGGGAAAAHSADGIGSAATHSPALARATGNSGRAAGRAGGMFGRTAGRAAGRAGARGLGGIAAKGVGKSLLKKIPGIGLLAGLGFGAQRLLSGDFVGAGLEVASGAASLIPGLGTAASIAIDGGLMARDMGAFGGPGGRNANAAAPGARATARPPRRRGMNWGMIGMGALAAGGLGGMAGMALSGFGKKDDQTEQLSAIEKRMNENRAAQDAASRSAQERIAAEMKALYEANNAINREILTNMRRLVQLESSAASDRA